MHNVLKRKTRDSNLFISSDSVSLSETCAAAHVSDPPHVLSAVTDLHNVLLLSHVLAVSSARPRDNWTQSEARVSTSSLCSICTGACCGTGRWTLWTSWIHVLVEALTSVWSVSHTHAHTLCCCRIIRPSTCVSISVSDVWMQDESFLASGKVELYLIIWCRRATRKQTYWPFKERLWILSSEFPLYRDTCDSKME